MRYHQITREERYTLATLRKQTPALPVTEIARLMGRHRSTSYREIRRNATHRDRAYRPDRAQEAANGRRRRSRKHSQFTNQDWQMVEDLLRSDLSPEQVSGWLARHRLLSISHETIYQHIWRDKRRGGDLWRRLRQRPKYRKALRHLRETGAPGRQEAYLRTTGRRRASARHRPLGDGHGQRRRKQALHRHTRRTCYGLHAHRQARRSQEGAAQPTGDTADP
jgi:IS30 family transposase